MKRYIALLLASVLVMALPVSAEGSYDWPFIEKIPIDSAYTQQAEHRGRVEKLTYTTHSYALEAVASGEYLSAADDIGTTPPVDRETLCGDETEFLMEKSLCVYLPYGYDPSQQYNVVYALHGTGAKEEYWLGDNRLGKSTCNMLDQMMERGECAPCIVVAPTYYSIPTDRAALFTDYWNGDSLANVWPMYFWEEMRGEIIPLIDSTYSTYADAPDAREHRAFVGLSRGSMTTVNSIMLHCLDQFAYFGNFSGIWCDFDVFQETLESEEYQDLPIRFWYNGNGTTDFSLENQEKFLNTVLDEMADRFEDGENFAFVVFPGGGHAFNCWLPDLYNCLRVFFQ